MWRPELKTPTKTILAIAGAELVIVSAIAAGEPTGGAFAVIVALALAPLAVWAVSGIAEQIAGPRFGIAAAGLYAVLPVAGRVLFYGTLRGIYGNHILPSLVGTRAPAWFALGVGVAVVARVAPARAAGVAGLGVAVVAAALWANIDWTTVYGNLHESTWSPTLVCALPLASLIGVCLRSPWTAAALGGWLGFFVLRGVHGPYYSGALWTGLAAAMPAVAVLIVSLGLLVPRLWPQPAPAADAR
jgi:hypothetical protein